MNLTQERKGTLAKILNEDVDRAKAWGQLQPQEALAQINALGHDFTVDELAEFGSQLRSVQSELGDEALEGVAGGIRGLEALIAPGLWSFINW